MFATALIVFRETLEAALFIGIVAAATRGVAGRTLWLSAGVLSGMIGALALAAGADRIGAWADGIGQDLVNVWILTIALLMLAWHCIWVSTHGREMSQEAKQLGTSTRDGERTPWALSLAVGLAVLREGAETVLFVSGFVTGSNSGSHTMLLGSALGLLAGSLLGVLMYFGLSRIRPHRLFAVTNTLVLLLAAALASQLARTLAQSGLVTAWSDTLWDSTWLLAADSPLGTFLHALIGYDARPSGLQLAFYICAIAIIGLATRQMRLRQARRWHPNPVLGT
ncbi:MAG TPA: FTR1 family protein [Methyloversatilis sp.]